MVVVGSRGAVKGTIGGVMTPGGNEGVGVSWCAIFDGS